MAKFMDVHNGFVGVTEHQLREARECDLAVEAAEGVHFEHAWLDPAHEAATLRRRNSTGSTASLPSSPAPSGKAAGK